VRAEYFKDLPRHREWTVIAYRLACDLHCAFDDTQTHRINSTDNSQSKRDTYVDAAIDTLEHMLRYAKDPKHAGALRRRRSDAYQRICSHYRLQRDFTRAWSSFWRAVRGDGGWRYLPYSLLLVMRISRPVSEIIPSNLLRRTLRKPQKYFSKAFWRMIVPAVLVRGRLRLLYALPSAVRRSMGRRTLRAYVFPSALGSFLWPEVYIAWKTFAMCDVVLTDTPKGADFALAWHPSTTYEPETGRIDELNSMMRVLNARCTDISKSNVGRVFGEVFGYRIEVDPLTYTGAILRKSEKNGKHDGVILQGPLSEIEPDFVYQKLVTNSTPGGIAEFRVFIVDCKPVAAYTLYAPLHDRFDYHHERGAVTDVRDIFNADELAKIQRFNQSIGLDFGCLDVLRDPNESRIYIIDCNNTPTGPLPSLSTADQLKIVRTIANEFRVAYIDRAPQVNVVPIPIEVTPKTTDKASAI